MKLAVLGDTHFGMRNDNILFHEYYKKFYQETFFPYLKKNKITTVIQTGDLFDRRKFISYNTLHLSKKYFFDLFRQNKIKLITYLGNHDIYYKNTKEINSIELNLKEYIDSGDVVCVTTPQTMEFDGIVIDIIPWICPDDQNDVDKFITDSNSQICFGHFEISGFEMDKGNICTIGTPRETLQKYEMVITGHFHHRSTDGHIFYIGSPGEITWADYNDKRGFHIFDTETRELEFIENPYRMFHKLIYDDSAETLESVDNKDFSSFTNTIVKVVVTKKDNHALFDRFMDKLYTAQPLDVAIVEDFVEYNQLSENDIIDQADSTTDIINKHIDNINFGVDNIKLKNIMREVYNEAQNLEPT